jgi:uncharacterized SAM-binding protein YcdF (DUF218 family)
MILLMMAVLGTGRARMVRMLSAGALVLLLIFASPAVATALLRSLEDRYPDIDVRAAPTADAIVVLGGAIHIPSVKHQGSGLLQPTDRVLRTLRLYRAGKAPIIVCSGGNNPTLSGLRTPEAQVLKALLEEWGVPLSSILVEDRSISTHENALFSFAMLNAKNIRHIILVTSATHMPRAAAAFTKAGFQVSAAPADFRTGWSDPDPIGRWIPSPISLVQSDLAIKELTGLLVYLVRGWI